MDSRVPNNFKMAKKSNYYRFYTWLPVFASCFLHARVSQLPSGTRTKVTIDWCCKVPPNSDCDRFNREYELQYRVSDAVSPSIVRFTLAHRDCSVYSMA